MITTNSARQVIVTLVGLATVLALALPGATAAVPKTTITIVAPGCNGCRIDVQQGIWDDQGHPQAWEGPHGVVKDGRLTLTVPTRRTHGMSMLVHAPWEGATGYVTTVAMRYANHAVGRRVSVADASNERRATACWAGTVDDAVTIRLVTQKVWVPGEGKRVRGTLAFTRVTQPWLPPMRSAWHGVLGSQDLNFCGRS